MSKGMKAYVHTAFRGVDGTCYSAAIIVAPDANRAAELLKDELRKAGLDKTVSEGGEKCVLRPPWGVLTVGVLPFSKGQG